MITLFHRVYFFPSLAECSKSGRYIRYKNYSVTVKKIVSRKLELPSNSLAMLDSQTVRTGAHLVKQICSCAFHYLMKHIFFGWVFFPYY